MRQLALVLVVFALVMTGCKKSANNGHETKTAKDANGYSYEYVENDPSGTRIYTLDNGLKIYLAVNKDEPRVQTYIAVRAGAKNDPRETTGLAHYFEHMMFKGTDKIGTKDWDKESVLIQAISDKFEEHAAETDPEKKAAIYAQIDSLSQEASQYAIANEYDKICSILGATGTNAWTSYEETVYVNEIPSNEIDRWAKVESERFANLVLRLFHTELETIFEEFNMNQDRDGRRLSNTIFAKLFKNHPYGTAIIGKGEHLKNPSMANVMKFKANYYVPNNIAICMSGDLDFEETVKIIDKYWGKMQKNDNIPEFTYTPEEERTAVEEFEIHGPEPENVCVVWRTQGNKSQEAKYLSMIGDILYNGKAGLMDLDLNTAQKVMGSYAYCYTLNDYGMFQMVGMPREGQSLEEVKDLLMAELDKIKKGEFDEWLLEAIVNEMKLGQIKQIEGNRIAYSFVNAFISQTPWEEEIFDIENYEKMTKDSLVKFANEFFKDNYLVAYKRIGEPDNVMHVDKPAITQLNIDRASESAFVTELKKEEPAAISPEFVDYAAKIQTTEIANGLPMSYIKNETNELFSLYYILDMGKDNDKKLALAVDYLDYLGTTDKTVDDLAKEWYRLGCNFYVSSGADRCYVYISGLDENLETAMKLMEEILANVKPDKEVYDEYVNSILKGRANTKLNKNAILGGLVARSKYGEESRYTNNLSEEELKAIDPEELTNIIKDMLNYKHQIFYYGPRKMDDVAKVIKENHNVSGNYKDYPVAKEYVERDYDKTQVFFVNYPMTQVLIELVSKDVKFDKSLLPISAMFNEYYGGSMSSIVFQEIREAKSLAYGCYAGYNEASKVDESNYVVGYLSTQPDKMKEALEALGELMNELKQSPESFEISRQAIISQINTERIIKSGIFWNYLANKELGIDNDYRKDVYEAVKNFTLDDATKFFNEHIQGKTFDIMIVGPKEKVDFNLLKTYGDVKELTVDEVFNF